MGIWPPVLYMIYSLTVRRLAAVRCTCMYIHTLMHDLLSSSSCVCTSFGIHVLATSSLYLLFTSAKSMGRSVCPRVSRCPNLDCYDAGPVRIMIILAYSYFVEI